MILVVMGVSGSGKTTVGRAVAGRLGWAYVEGDDFHPESNRRKMASGVPLTDDDRGPWLAALGQELARHHAAGRDVIAACSGLKRSYRKALSVEAGELRWVYLQVAAEELSRRLRARTGHYFPESLLQSQLSALEDPTGEPGVIVLKGDRPLDELVEEIVRAVRD